MNIFKKVLFMTFCYLSIPYGIAFATDRSDENNNVLQQSYKKIKGNVIDDSGEPIIGANVLIKGTSKGVITDINGMFSIDAKENQTLEISFIGYTTRQVKIGNKNNFNIVLKDNSQMLNEVVVVGYGVQTKKSVVGAISQTGSKELMKSGGVTSVGEALQGKMPGVTAIYTSGRPGEKDVQFYIRGQSSWNGDGQPLVLVDGIEGDINDLDINEVESVSVLKDASATAVYGVKGANGVILITTKRGQKGKAAISISANVTLKMVSKLPEQMDAYDAADVTNHSILNELAYKESSWSDYMPSQVMDKYRNQTTQHQREAYPNIDWADYLLKDVGSDHRVNFSVRGGTDAVKYFCNISYQHEGDMFKDFDNLKGYKGGFDYNRFNYRSNLDFDITKLTKLSVNINGSYGMTKSPSAKAEYYYYNGIYTLGPMQFYPVFDDGSYGFDNGGNYNLRNPVSDLCSAGSTTENRLSLVSDFTLNQDLKFILKGLSFKGHFAITNVILSNKELYDGGTTATQIVQKTYINDGKDVVYQYPADFKSDYEFSPIPWYLKDYMIKDDQRVRRTNYDLSLNYNGSFGKHNVSALALFKREQYAKGNMFPSYREDWVGRLTYNYNTKYFIEVNGAYNGSEKFGPNYRFELFPSVALGWLISEEKFMKNLKWIDKLKIRGSYGLVGDDNFSGRWKYMTQWGSYNMALDMNKFSYDQSRFSPYTLYKEASLGNPDLHWEKSTKKNIGFEFAGLKNQVQAEFDYFTEKRTDIMVEGKDRAIPSWFGIAPSDANSGEVHVKGFEFVLSGNRRIGKDIYLNSKFTYSHAVDKIINKDEPLYKPKYQKDAGYPIGQNHSLIPGELMKSWDDIYMSSALTNGQGSKRIGYYDLVDYNCDGNINNSYDVVPWGYPTRPQNTWTLDLGGTFKGFGVSIQFYGQNNTTRSVNLNGLGNSQRMYFKERADIWSPQNPDGAKTITAWKLDQANSDPLKNLYDGSMVRLKMVEISYAIPQSSCKKLGVKNLRFFANGNNLALWTDLPDDRDYNGWNDYRGAYPTVKRINLGFNLDF